MNNDGLFYYIDKLGKGDYLYLTDAQNIYLYIYENTAVAEADDWCPIYSRSFSCLALTSYEPIGISTHRIIVRSNLDETTPFTNDYELKKFTMILI